MTITQIEELNYVKLNYDTIRSFRA